MKNFQRRHPLGKKPVKLRNSFQRHFVQESLTGTFQGMVSCLTASVRNRLKQKIRKETAPVELLSQRFLIAYFEDALLELYFNMFDVTHTVSTLSSQYSSAAILTLVTHIYDIFSMLNIQ